MLLLLFGGGGTAVWPDVALVVAGTVYGPTGVEYTGTLVAFSDELKLDVTTGKLVKILTNKVCISL
jgi:hypothetical protein